MTYVTDLDELADLYGTPAEASIIKVADHLTPLYRKWIEASRFCILSTVGPEGTDASPRGDDGMVVRITNAKTVLMPDWRGNNRMDSLRNIVRDGRASLMFMVPGATNVVRVNGTAKLSVQEDTTKSFEQKGRHPRSVIVFEISEVYSQCARAIMRASLWNGEDLSGDLPTVGALLEEAKARFDGTAYDVNWAGRATQTMW